MSRSPQRAEIAGACATWRLRCWWRTVHPPVARYLIVIERVVVFRLRTGHLGAKIAIRHLSMRLVDRVNVAVFQGENFDCAGRDASYVRVNSGSVVIVDICLAAKGVGRRIG
jgi:hypothetical protein